jgi:hypothetical protein
MRSGRPTNQPRTPLPLPCVLVLRATPRRLPPQLCLRLRPTTDDRQKKSRRAACLLSAHKFTVEGLYEMHSLLRKAKQAFVVRPVESGRKSKRAGRRGRFLGIARCMQAMRLSGGVRSWILSVQGGTVPASICGPWST